MSASLQRSDHLSLMGDGLFPAVDEAFRFLKKLFQGGAVHGGSLAAGITVRAVFLPVERGDYPAGGSIRSIADRQTPCAASIERPWQWRI